MTCDEARGSIPLDLYGALDDAGALHAHLESCPACRKDRDEVRAVCAALDTATTPAVNVDAAAIHAQAIAAARAALRRWKRRTLAAVALAASLAAVLLVRPQVEIGNGAFVVRWADRPAEPRPVERITPIVRAAPERDRDLDDRMRILSDLVLALRQDVESTDQKRRDEVSVLVARLEALRLQTLRNWDETRRDVKALYTAQFGGKYEGERQ